MKKAVTMILALLLAWSAAAQVQDCPTITENGKTYYLYTVQKGEGLYRISKNFGVTQDEIIAANPVLLHEGLRLEQQIRIPATVQASQNAQSEQAGQTAATVQPTETKAEDAGSAAQVIHVIQSKETLYGISRRYGVTIAQIVEANPEVARKMPVGGKLIIPQSSDVQTSGYETAQQPATPAATQTAETNAATVQSPTLPTTVPSTDTLATQVLPVRIACMLPFMLDAQHITPMAERFVEFYEGMLLAVNDARRRGMSIELHTFDIEKNDIKIQSVLRNPVLKTMDLIVGPAYSGQIKYVSDFSFSNKINTLIPFTSSVSDLNINPYLIQFNSTPEYEMELAVNRLVSDNKQPNLLLVHVDGEEADEMDFLKLMLKNRKQAYTEVRLNAGNADTLRTLVSSKKSNLLVFRCRRFGNVSHLMPIIKQIASERSVGIVGDYAWMPFADQIEVPMYYTTLFKPTDGRLQAYQANFDHYFSADRLGENPRYDLLGYDLTTCFLNAIGQYGVAGLNNGLQQYEFDGLSISPRFSRKTAIEGYTNTGVHLMEWKNQRNIVVE